ncbi:MAG TPA: [FeFe] hydrogenase H-cluster radical SAM maturase HydE [Firmicutes bacterium]|nr:[FeFe] hydrogenase H-cluster radical SAM maturase HydE [Bacillota bacterium]
MNRKARQIISKAVRNNTLSKEEIILLLSCENSHNYDLFQAADLVRRRYLGNAVHLRGIIEFSNYCGRLCRYCGLRCANKSLQRYRMTADDIYKAAVDACVLGYRTIVLQSGEDAFYDADTIASLVRRLKELGLAVTLSLGERSYEEYRLWRKEGADRYLLKHETEDPLLYEKLHPDMNYTNRLNCLYWLRELGYQIGSGCMVGLPGQTPEMLAADVLLLKELDVEMAGIGPFIPNPSTPLATAAPGTADMTLKMVALTRLLLPRSHLPATTALVTLAGDGRERALCSGANVIMLNVTPLAFRDLYNIYPNKERADEAPAAGRRQIENTLSALGRPVAQNAGHSPKRKFRRAAG